jgi:putative ABC transport system permease protein
MKRWQDTPAESSGFAMVQSRVKRLSDNPLGSIIIKILPGTLQISTAMQQNTCRTKMLAQLTRLRIELLESARLAKHQLFAYPTRSLLTGLGIMIGIAAVVLMDGAINGINDRVAQALATLGSDVLYVEQAPWTAADDLWRYRNRPDIAPAMADKLNQLISATPHSLLGFAVAAPSIAQTITYQKRALTDVNLVGTNADYSLVLPTNCQAGRFLDVAECRSGQNVCVIGSDIDENLFAGQDPIGKMVLIGRQLYRVIGVFESQGSFLGLLSFDSDVLIPLANYQRFFQTGADNASIEVKVKNPKLLSEAREELRDAVRRVRGLLPGEEDNFTINAQDAFRAMLAPAKTGIAAAGLSVTGLALFVGVIGIMNVTFASVKDRIREIGTRKALGAHRRTILLQFLMESVTISLLGGASGLALAFGLSYVGPIFFPDFPIPISSDSLMLALTVSILAGILSGLAPAWIASRLDPVSALRNE